MSLVVNLLLFAAVAALLAPMGMFCLEVIGSLFWREKRIDAAGDATRIAVLIPAHNEEAVLGETLAALHDGSSLTEQDPTDRSAKGEMQIVVIADNCDDDTAAIARAAGAVALERSDSHKRGKGYALDHAVAFLADNPPEVVVVIDADCLIRPSAVLGLARAVVAADRPVQGLNLTDRDIDCRPQQVISQLANRFTNLIRPMGLASLGLPTRLTGTGMALPWADVSAGQLASGNLVEDMQLGIEQTLRGRGPIFSPRFRVSSRQPDSQAAFDSQRTRWEHGHLQVAAVQAPRLVWRAIIGFRPALVFTALDLLIPPLALLAVVWCLLAMLCGVAAIWFSPAPLLLLLCGGGAFGLAFFAGWLAHCRREVPLSALLAAPRYLLMKLPIYARLLLGRRQKDWVKTER